LSTDFLLPIASVRLLGAQYRSILLGEGSRVKNSPKTAIPSWAHPPA
jgi:hypothetical protein